MATLKEVKTLAVKDVDFRRSLFTDPEETLRTKRLILNDRELTTLKMDIKKLTSSMTIKELDLFFRDNPLGW